MYAFGLKCKPVGFEKDLKRAVVADLKRGRL